MVSLRYFAPAAPLRALVSSYYRFDVEAPAFADLLRAELAQMRFTLAGAAKARFADGWHADCPPAMLTGAANGPVIFEARGPFTVVGVGLLPAGWAALIGVSADTLSDRIADLGTVIGGAAAATLDRLHNAANDCEIRTILDAMLISLVAHAHRAPLWFTRAADEWLIASRSPTVDDLLLATGVSARQVERLAKRIYGASPKLIARKYRALQAAVRIGTGEARSWADAAGEAFYDQPHFIREFKQFIGMTPHRFAIEMAPVMRLTIAERRRLPTLPKLALYS